MKKIFLTMLACLVINNPAFSDENAKNAFVGAAYRDNFAYSLLNEITTFAGGRLAGSTESEIARKILIRKLDSLKIPFFENSYDINAWQRGEDVIFLTSPFRKELRAYAAGYSGECSRTEAEVLIIRGGAEQDYQNIDAKGKIILFEPSENKNAKRSTRGEKVKIAAKFGAVGVMFPNDKSGGMVLMSAPSFDATQAELPVFCISKEDRLMLAEQIKSGINPKITFEVRSKCFPAKMTNLRAVFKGKSEKKVLLLAHYDSWDISTGAIDNGAGTAVLMQIAMQFKKYFPENYFTVECAWTDAEEIGILGAKKLAETLADSVVAVVNMDMPGSPSSINIMGHEEMRENAENFLLLFRDIKSK